MHEQKHNYRTRDSLAVTDPPCTDLDPKSFHIYLFRESGVKGLAALGPKTGASFPVLHSSVVRFKRTLNPAVGRRRHVSVGHGCMSLSPS